ncbi:hypothetical protein EJ06DRAFT_558175 [Trichodelitschia bisporula]|uniref:CFEM domain-containing protein n=1 Tax=Trichodelitschia bisporula TaxID=703511 RepID=A0A6G1HQZ3_9PEZI|nr:hypothetical protein EJ06DRAFT_558175 [Trichodelitschia bisporula]
MRYNFQALIGLCFAALTAAQSLDQLPSCVVSKFLANIQGSGCGFTDVQCICSNKKLLDNMQTAVTAGCPPEDKQKAVDASNAFCPSLYASLVSSAVSSASSSITAQSMPLPTSTSTMKSGVKTDTKSYPTTGSYNLSGTATYSATKTPSTFTGNADRFLVGKDRMAWTALAVGLMALVFAEL